MLQKSLFFFIAVSFLFSCKKNKDTTTILTGEIPNNNDNNRRYIYLKKITITENDNEKLILIDSTKITEKSTFTFNPLKLDSGIYQLDIHNFNAASFIVEDYSPSLHLKIAMFKDVAMPYNLHLSGSHSMQELTIYLELVKRFMNESVMLLDTYYKTNDVLKKIEQKEKLDSIKKSFEQKLKHLVLEIKSGPLTTLYAANNLFENESNFPFLDSLATILQQSPYRSEHIRNYIRKINKLRAISIGGQINEIALKNPSNQEIKLSSFRGKYVFIDFWAAWCTDCRRENPALVKIYQKYKNKKFDILGISLDKEKQQWIDAIKKDQLTWQHGSELRGWESPIAKEYQITSIPSNLLINPEGKIIAKNIDLNLLDKKLEELLNN